jgi:hypothetical protein
MKLEPMTDDVPVLTQRLPEPAVEVAFASWLTEPDRSLPLQEVIALATRSFREK